MKIKKTIATIRKIGIKRVIAIIYDKYILSPIYFVKYKFFIIDKKYELYQPDYTIISEELLLNTNDCYNNVSNIDSIIHCNYKLFGIEFNNKELQWNRDFRTKFSWENSFYKNINLKSYTRNKDSKFPLEFSRLNHLLILSLTYNKTKNKDILLEIFRQIKKWEKDNPISYGVSWACTMDVALRAVNIVTIYGLLSKDMPMEPKQIQLFNKLVYLHGAFIKDNLENKNSCKNNHYLSNVIGLLFIGIYYNKITWGKNLIKFAINELEKEIQSQTNQDGTNFEGSTYYHKFVFELFFYSKVMADYNNLKFSTKYVQILEKIYSYLRVIVKPNNEIPLIGDCDNGYVLNVNNYFAKSAREAISILDIYEQYYNIDKSEEEIEIYKNKSDKIYSFIDSGNYLIKNSKLYLFIRCGKIGSLGMGGHSHNDQLSFELNAFGKDFFIDPGTAYYYGDHNIRNENRRTKSHNTLFYNEYEQNEFQEQDIFLLREQTFAKCIEFENSAFIGEHYGYLKKNNNIHRRTIKVNDDVVIINDQISNMSDSPQLSFNIHPNVQLIEKKEGVILVNDDIKVFLEVMNYRIEEGIYCYEYGDYVKTKRIIVSLEELNCTTIIKVLT